MKVYRVYDSQIILSVMLNDEIWNTIAEDGQNKDDYTVDCTTECWLAFEVNGEIVGLYNLHRINAITLQIHAHVLPEFRRNYSYDTGHFALKWIYDNAPEYNKVIAEIPFLYPNVKSFTMQFGFDEEGVNTQSYLKGGEIVDQWRLGITRASIAEFLDKQEAA